MKIRYFSAEWCAPCKKLKPKFKALADELGVEMDEIDIEKTYTSVQSVPTVELVDDDGESYVFQPANMPWVKVKEMVEEVLAG